MDKWSINILIQKIKNNIDNELLKNNFSNISFDFLTLFKSTETRSINFDNKNNDQIYMIKQNFIDDKKEYINFLVSNLKQKNFYSWIEYNLRDFEINNFFNHKNITIDIIYFFKSIDIQKKDFIKEKINFFFKLFNTAISEINDYIFVDFKLEIKEIDYLEIFKNKSFVTLFQQNPSFIFSNKMEDNSFLLINNFQNYQAEFLNNINFYDTNNFIKIFYKNKKGLLDMGNIYIDQKNNLVNFVINFNSLLLIVFDKKNINDLFPKIQNKELINE